MSAVSTARIHATFPLPARGAHELEQAPVTSTIYPIVGGQPRDGLLADVRGVSGLITLLSDRVDAELLDAAGPSLRVVANYAVGTDNIDLAAAGERGVVVTNTPDVLDEATADLTMALLLALARRVTEADRFVRSGASWTWRPDLFVGLDVSAGATLGIVGLGRIGLAVAKRASAFGMQIIATGSRAYTEEASAHGVEPATFSDLLRLSDVVSVHCPLTPQTHHLFGVAEFAAMKTTALLVNTARGPIVDEMALIAALDKGEIAGAGLDVFEWEPRVSPQLLDRPNVITLPHVGSAGSSTRENMGLLAVRNALAVVGGQEPLTSVGTPSRPHA